MKRKLKNMNDILKAVAVCVFLLFMLYLVLKVISEGSEGL